MLEKSGIAAMGSVNDLVFPVAVSLTKYGVGAVSLVYPLDLADHYV